MQMGDRDDLNTFIHQAIDKREWKSTNNYAAEATPQRRADRRP